MSDFVNNAPLDGATKNLFEIEFETLEQLRHLILDVRHVGDSTLTAMAVLLGESNALHWSRPVSALSRR